MIQVVHKAFRSYLAGGTALIAALGGTAIYAVQAPAGAAMPYVVINIAGGGDENLSPRETINVVVAIKTVATNAGTAAAVADLIKARLHDADGSITMTDSWAAWRCTHEAAIFYVENADRVQYWHAGGNYRLRAENTGS